MYVSIFSICVNWKHEELLFLFQATAESRKREFEELLSEHAQIVKEVFHMQGEPETKTLADKENNVFPPSKEKTEIVAAE